LLPFVKEGIEQGEKAIHIINAKDRTWHLGQLREGGVDVDAAMRRGQMDVFSWEETYLDGGSFHPDAALAMIDRVLGEARRQCYPRTRGIGDMDWFREKQFGVEGILSYEARLNRLLLKYDDSVICAYDLSRFSGLTVLDAMRTHPTAIVGGILQQNPFYVSPESVLAELRGAT
jgi:hypothetical protein